MKVCVAKLRVLEFGADELRTLKVGEGEICSLEVGAATLRVLQVGPAEHRALEVGAEQVRALKVGLVEPGLLKVGVVELCTPEVDPGEVEWPKAIGRKLAARKHRHRSLYISDGPRWFRHLLVWLAALSLPGRVLGGPPL